MSRRYHAFTGVRRQRRALGGNTALTNGARNGVLAKRKSGPLESGAGIGQNYWLVGRL